LCGGIWPSLASAVGEADGVVLSVDASAVGWWQFADKLGRIFQLVGDCCCQWQCLVLGTAPLIILTSESGRLWTLPIAEGDPDLNTPTAWTYYWNALPDQVSGVVAGLWLLSTVHDPHPSPQIAQVVSSVLIGAYLLSSLNINKDDRYVLPYLPVLSLFLAMA